MRFAEEMANKGYLITFGIRPQRPETVYGYIIKVNQEKLVWVDSGPQSKKEFYWSKGL